MSSTYSSGKRVTAMRCDDGTVLYALHEETCCSNVSPRVPRWAVHCIGTLETVMESIFYAASHTIGGCLKGANGRPITPTGYVQGWLKELAAPYLMRSHRIELYVDGSWSAPIGKDHFERITPRLIASGHQELVDQLQRGETIEVSMADMPSVVDAIYGGGGGWKLVKNTPRAGDEMAYDLAYDPLPSKVLKLPTETMVKFKTQTRFGNYEYAVKNEDGTFGQHSCNWQSLTRFFANEAKNELAFPNTYKKRYKAFEAIIEAAPEYDPSAFVVQVKAESFVQKWEKSNLENAIQKLPHTVNGETYTFEIPTGEQDIWVLERLYPQATFVLKSETKKSCVTVQLDLLAG